MSEIRFKTNMPDKAAKVVMDALATEASRLRYSMRLSKKRLSKLKKNIKFHPQNLLMNGVLKILGGKIWNMSNGPVSIICQCA